MSVGVIYLLTDTPLAARLVVSLYTLRKWYTGPVTIFTTRPQSHAIGRLMAKDSRLGVETLPLTERRGRGYVSSYLTKIRAVQSSPYDATVFLDADTIVVGSIADLIWSAETSPVTATQFCNTSTTEEPVRSRLRGWRRLRGEGAKKFGLQRVIRVLLNNRMPAINTGVFAVQPGTPFLDEWDELARLGRHAPLPDEIAFQLLLLRHPYRILGGHFNCHPCMANVPDVRIWHFVAASHMEYRLTQDVWIPTYRECQDLNLAGIRSWSRIEKHSPSAIPAKTATGRKHKS